MRRRYVHIPFTVTLGALGLATLVWCAGVQPPPPETAFLVPAAAGHTEPEIGAG